MESREIAEAILFSYFDDQSKLTNLDRSMLIQAMNEYTLSIRKELEEKNKRLIGQENAHSLEMQIGGELLRSVRKELDEESNSLAFFQLALVNSNNELTRAKAKIAELENELQMKQKTIDTLLDPGY